jgi:hypothetical protein
LNTPLNTFFVLLGVGHNGKSSTTDILRAVFESYCVNLPSTILDSVSDASKALSDIKPNTVFTFIDEVQAKTGKKSALIKKLSDGYVIYNRLYTQGTTEMKTRGKLVINSNHPLVFDDNDEAVRNRILYFKFNKIFTKNPQLVNNVNMFPERQFIARGLTPEMKTYLFLLFALKAKEINTEISPPIPQDIMTKDQLINWKHFIKSNFELRKDSFVSKFLLFQKFKKAYPDFEYTNKDIIKGIASLPAEFNVTYEKGSRYTDGRGVFIGLFSTDEDGNILSGRNMDFETEILNEAGDDEADIKAFKKINIGLEASVEDMLVDFST